MSALRDDRYEPRCEVNGHLTTEISRSEAIGWIELLSEL